MARAATARGKSAGSRKKRRANAAPVEPGRRITWFGLALLVIGGALAVRLGINAAELFPVQFDEGQYWAYGQELDWGYYSKPPLVAAVIRVFTDLLGDSLFTLRLFSPLAHALIAWMIFLTGSRIWDGRTGFWAATGYTVAPGVALSAMIASTDPVMMACWAVALYALVLGLESDRFWSWVACGAAIGLGLLAKYTMLAFPVAVLGYLALSAEPGRRDWRGFGIACGVGLVVFAPNLVWNASNGFATIGHVAGDADPGKGYFHPVKMAEFVGAQLAVIGPPFFLAMVAALAGRARWRDDWGMRLAAWQGWLLLGGVIVLSFLTRANGNWAAPAYVGGALMAARWLLGMGWRRWLTAQVALGLTFTIVLYAVALLYAMKAEQLPAFADPFRKTRHAEQFCELALGAVAEENAAVLLSDDRKRLSECMFAGQLGWDDVAIWNPGLIPSNHHELVSTLREGDERRMVLAITGSDERAREIAGRFRERTEIESGAIQTHRDKKVPYHLWVVEGFEGYGVEY